MRDGCPFCDYDGAVIQDYGDAIVFEPLNPVVLGHVLVVPREHVPDFISQPSLTARVMRRAAEHAKRRGIAPCNLIVSAGAEATQTVFHLHVHLIPRRAGDGLALPWTGWAEE